MARLRAVRPSLVFRPEAADALRRFAMKTAALAPF